MLHEITRTNSQINKAVEGVNNDLNIVKNLGKINNQYKNSDKDLDDKRSTFTDIERGSYSQKIKLNSKYTTNN